MRVARVAYDDVLWCTGFGFDAIAGRGLRRFSTTARKFAAICEPQGVATLSGWNWTPYRGFDKCSTASTSPRTRPRAVTRNALPSKLSSSTVREW